MGLIARIKDRLFDRRNVIEIEKLEGDIPPLDSLKVIGWLEAANVKTGSILLVSGENTSLLTKSLLDRLDNNTQAKSTLYRHHIIITTEYGGAYKNLVFDIYNTTATAVTKTNIPPSMAGKFYVCTGNIISATGVTTGICHAKFELVNSNPQVRGINSSGAEFYAGINNLNDTVETITKITHE